MSKGFLIVDGSNVGHAAAAGKTLTAGDQEVHAVNGFLRVLRPAVTKFSMLTPIVLWDGASWRKDAFAGYKASRDKETVTVHDERIAKMRASFKAQRPLIMRGLQHLGVTQMQCYNLEADDLAGALVKRYVAQGKTIVMLSGDRDWITLVQPKVGWLDPVPRDGTYRRVNAANFVEEMGVPNGRAYLDVKALMGDNSDDIPGVGGIGEKGAIELVNKYGSVVDFFNASITEKGLPKKFQTLADDMDKQAIYHRNIALMDLQHPKIPKPVNLRITKGAFDEDKFRLFCRELLFKSMLTDLPNWMQPFKRDPE